MTNKLTFFSKRFDKFVAKFQTHSMFSKLSLLSLWHEYDADILISVGELKINYELQNMEILR